MSSSEDGQQKYSAHKGVIMILTLILPPKDVIKDQPSKTAIFGIKSKVLICTLTVNE